MPVASRLAAALPDEPRWLETRAMLQNRRAVVSGGDGVADGFVVRVQDGAVSAAAVVGRPPARAIVAAVAGTTDLTPIVAQTTDAAHVAAALQGAGLDWSGERAIVHVRAAAPPLPALPPDAIVRLLDPADSLAHLPPGLRHEQTHAQAFAPVAAVFLEGRAVSFCYPVWRTERLWDISVDTLDPHRGLGLGAAAVQHMIDLMGAEGRQPVWLALESNQPSLRLGAKLGFVPIGEVTVFSRGGWVFLSGGFTGA